MFKSKLTKEELYKQYNDVISYINAILIFRPFDGDKELIKAALKYAKKEKYNVRFIRKELNKNG